MSKEAARILRRAEEDPMDPDEVWEALEEYNEGAEWDIQKLLEGEIDEETLREITADEPSG